MSVINNIETIKSQLSNSDLKLANYTIENLEEIPRMTSTELATKSQTSQATVIRFSKKLGYRKFSDFKLALSKEVEKKISNEYSNISFSDPFQSAKAKLVHNNQMVLEAAAEMLDETTIRNVVEVLLNAQKIYVYGVGSSVLAAEDIRQKWMKVGKIVVFDKDTYILSQQLQHDKEKNVFWGISHSGKNRDVLTLLEQANSAQLVTVGMSQLGKNQLAKNAQIPIQTSSTDKIDNGHYGSGATHSVLLQLMTIDIIYYFFIKELVARKGE